MQVVEGWCAAIMPRSLLSVPRYSDFWELAGGGGEPGGRQQGGEKGAKKGKRCEWKGKWEVGGAEPMGGLAEGWKEEGWGESRRGWRSSPGTTAPGMWGQEEECRQPAGFTALLGISGDGSEWKWFPLLGESHKITDRVSPAKVSTLIDLSKSISSPP